MEHSGVRTKMYIVSTHPVRIWGLLQTAGIFWMDGVSCTLEDCFAHSKAAVQPTNPSSSLQLLKAASQPWWHSSCMSVHVLSIHLLFVFFFFSLGFVFVSPVYPTLVHDSNVVGWDVFLVSYPQRHAGPLAILTSPSFPARMPWEQHRSNHSYSTAHPGAGLPCTPGVRPRCAALYSLLAAKWKHVHHMLVNCLAECFFCNYGKGTEGK